MPEVNPAVPDMERLPCQYDDVVLPAGLLTSSINAYFYSNRIRVKSFTFGSEKWTNDDLINNANSEIFQSKCFLFIFEAILAYYAYINAVFSFSRHFEVSASYDTCFFLVN